jgi:UDP-3-O-[3-hydroxymyristoyl] glucosamine N-acyltransferase
MLIGYDKSLPLWILGTGISAQQIRSYIKQTDNVEATCLPPERFSLLTSNDQCIPGFYNYRNSFSQFVESITVPWVTYIHPLAFIDSTSKIGSGSVIMPLAMIDFESTIGRISMISSYSMIGHGASIGNHSVICPNSCIGGSTHIGDNFWCGQSVIIADRLTITNNVTCIMSSVVTKNIIESGRYFGNRKVKTLEI